MNELDKWMSQDGQVSKISDLGFDHLLSIIAMAYRRPDSLGRQRSKLVSLEKEALKRLLKLHPHMLKSS